MSRQDRDTKGSVSASWLPMWLTDLFSLETPIHKILVPSNDIGTYMCTCGEMDGSMIDVGLAVTRAELRGPVVNGVLCSWVKEACHSSGHCPWHILDAQSKALTQWALQ